MRTTYDDPLKQIEHLTDIVNALTYRQDKMERQIEELQNKVMIQQFDLERIEADARLAKDVYQGASERAHDLSASMSDIQRALADIQRTMISPEQW